MLFRSACGEAIRALRALPTRTPSLRLMADQAAEVLASVSHAFIVLGLLVDDPARPALPGGSIRFRVPDLLPAGINAMRAFVMIGVVELIWIVTAWPNGAGAIAFATIAVVLFAPRADQAYAVAKSFLIGVSLAAALAAIFDFAVLPGLIGFTEFSIALGLVLVPAGMLMILTWPTGTFLAIAFLFLPLVAPANQESYDPQQFYNSAAAIVVGVGIGVVSFRLLPPLSPAFRTRRLLMLTLRELRRLAMGPIPRTTHDWEGRIYGRLTVLPDQAEPLQRAQLLAALSVGTEIIHLRHFAPLFDQRRELDAALAAVASGNSALATERLARLVQRLAALPGTEPGSRTRLRACATIVALSEALARHAEYFNAGAGQSFNAGATT